MLFDIILIPFDSFWHKKYLAMKREHGRAESNLRYSESIREDQEADLSELSKKDWMQAQAIRAFNEERDKTRELVETLQRQLSEYQQRYLKSERENRTLSAKLEDARRNLAQEFDNRDGLMESIEEITTELAEYKDHCRRLKEDLDATGERLTQRTRELDELRQKYEALTHEDGGEALAG